jgi:glyoxylase-like metal-dependent hydrolase (beta-lactamase superfamily II)
VGDRTIESLYEQVRGVAPSGDVFTHHEVVEVAPGIRTLALRTPTLPPAAHTNVYLVGPVGGPVVVVDPGSPYPEEQAALAAALTDVPIAAIALTHHHGDHTGGAQALADARGVPIVAHAVTADALEGIVTVTRTLADGEDIDGLVAVHTPGHAWGHLCFTLGNATIAGDMVAGVGTILIAPGDGDMAVYFQSLERLLAVGGTLLPAHGPPIPDGPAKCREYLAHRRMREARVVAALTDTPSTLADLVTTAYADTPRALWPLAERSLASHLEKLVRESRATFDGVDRWSR